jgi:hypothetical protein
LLGLCLFWKMMEDENVSGRMNSAFLTSSGGMLL